MESSQTRDQTHVPCIARQILKHWTTRKVLLIFLSEWLSPALAVLWASAQRGCGAALGNSVHYRKIKNFRRCAAPASHGCDHPVLGPGLPKVSVGGRGTRRGAGERNQPWRHSPRSQDTSWPGRDLQTSGRRSELSSVAPRPGLDGGSPRGAQRRGREAAAHRC